MSNLFKPEYFHRANLSSISMLNGPVQQRRSLSPAAQTVILFKKTIQPMANKRQTGLPLCSFTPDDKTQQEV